MSPLAELVLRSGGQVTGCDARRSAAMEALQAAGAHVTVGHDPLHVEGCAALVVTAAVAADHPEIAAARRRGIPVLKRAEALAAIVNRGQVIGIAGTHGKTTTTALTTAVLEAAGLDPTTLVGGRVPAWNGNLRRGADRLFVVEADEYDHSFLTLDPFIAVVTNLEADHLDIFGSLAAVEAAFDSFVRRVPESGMIAGCADDAGVARLFARLRASGERAVSYGLAAGAMLRAEDVQAGGAHSSFVVRERGERLGRATISAPGLHNVRNALAAVAVARRLGAPWGAIAEGLDAHSGIERRFEHVGEAAGVVLVDDYAHHPTEVAATLAAARGAHPQRRLIAVFQPHLFTRTRDFADEFGRSLAAADLVFVTDVFAAREAPLPGIDGSLIARSAAAAGAQVHYHVDRASLPAEVARALEPGDLCLTLGAGDLNHAAREILALLQNTARR